MPARDTLGRRHLAATLADATDGTTARRGSRTGLGLRAAAVAGRRSAEQRSSARTTSPGSQSCPPKRSKTIAACRGHRASSCPSQRRRLHEVIDALEAELAARYKSGLEPSLERLQ